MDVFKKENKVLSISLIVIRNICLAFLITLVLAFVCGYKFLNILTGSMSPTMPKNTVIVIKHIPISKIEVGDVITYKTSSGTLVTHRVVEINEFNNQIQLSTQGDASNNRDTNVAVDKPINATQNQYVGVVEMHFKNLGLVLDFVRANIIMIGICILLAIFIVSYV